MKKITQSEQQLLTAYRGLPRTFQVSILSFIKEVTETLQNKDGSSK